MVPPIVFVVPLFLMLDRIHLRNTYGGLVLIFTAFNLPFTVWMLRSFFEDVPIELEEAAWIDGASRLHAFRADHHARDSPRHGCHRGLCRAAGLERVPVCLAHGWAEHHDAARLPVRLHGRARGRLGRDHGDRDDRCPAAGDLRHAGAAKPDQGPDSRRSEGIAVMDSRTLVTQLLDPAGNPERVGSFEHFWSETPDIWLAQGYPCPQPTAPVPATAEPAYVKVPHVFPSEARRGRRPHA